MRNWTISMRQWISRQKLVCLFGTNGFSPVRGPEEMRQPKCRECVHRRYSRTDFTRWALTLARGIAALHTGGGRE